MPDPILSLDHDQVKVAPGSQASIKITVRSTSSRVEGFRLDVIGGAPGRWTEVNPPEVDVYPGEEAAATVVFSPPTGQQTLSGTFPFGVRAQSTESSDDSAVVEGDVYVGEVDGLQAKLVPVTSSGRWRGRHVLQLSNQGNTDVELHLSATDPDDQLRVQIQPQRVDLGVGEEQAVRLTVRPRRPIVLGAPARLPFQIAGEPVVVSTTNVAGPYVAPGQLRVEGAVMQRAVLNKAALVITAILVLALVAGGVWIRTHPPDHTVTLSQITAVPAPALARVRAKGIAYDQIRITWPTSLQQITSYAIFTAKGIKLQDVSWEASSAIVTSYAGTYGPEDLKPRRRYCFQVAGMRYDTKGEPSKVCAKTKRKPPVAGPTSTPDPTTPVRFWLVADLVPKVPVTAGNPSASPTASASPSATPTPTPSADPANLTAAEHRSLVRATTLQNKLLRAGFVNAQVVDSGPLTALTIMDEATTRSATFVPAGPPMWIVAVGQYPNQYDDLARDCLRLKQHVSSDEPCIVAQAPGA